MPGGVGRYAVLCGSGNGCNRVGDGRIGQPRGGTPRVHHTSSGATPRAGPYHAVGRVGTTVYGSARTVQQGEGLFISKGEAPVVAQGNGGTMGYAQCGVPRGAVVQCPIGAYAIDRHGHIAVEVPAVTKGIVQPKLVAAGGGGCIGHRCVQLYRRTAGGHIRAGVYRHIGRDGHGDRGVVGAAEVVRYRVRVGIAAGGKPAYAGLRTVGGGGGDVRPCPMRAVTIGTIYRGELYKVRVEGGIKIQ